MILLIMNALAGRVVGRSSGETQEESARKTQLNGVVIVADVSGLLSWEVLLTCDLVAIKIVAFAVGKMLPCKTNWYFCSGKHGNAAFRSGLVMAFKQRIGARMSLVDIAKLSDLWNVHEVSFPQTTLLVDGVGNNQSCCSNNSTTARKNNRVEQQQDNNKNNNKSDLNNNNKSDNNNNNNNNNKNHFTTTNKSSTRATQQQQNSLIEEHDDFMRKVFEVNADFLLNGIKNDNRTTGTTTTHEDGTSVVREGKVRDTSKYHPQITEPTNQAVGIRFWSTFSPWR